MSKEFYGNFAVAVVLGHNPWRNTEAIAGNILKEIVEESKLGDNFLKIKELAGNPNQPADKIKQNVNEDDVELQEVKIQEWSYPMKFLKPETIEKITKCEEIKAIAWLASDSTLPQVIGNMYSSKISDHDAYLIRVNLQKNILQTFVLLEGNKLMIVVFRNSIDESKVLVVSDEFFVDPSSKMELYDTMQWEEQLGIEKELKEIDKNGTRADKLEKVEKNLLSVKIQLKKVLPKNYGFWTEVYGFLTALGSNPITSPFKMAAAKSFVQG